MDFSSTDLKAFSDHFLSVPRTTELISSKVGTGKEVESCKIKVKGYDLFQNEIIEFLKKNFFSKIFYSRKLKLTLM